MKKQHKIAPEVKADILRRVKEEGVSVATAAKDHGVSEQSIYSWIGGTTQRAPSWLEFAKLKRERDELLRMIGELTVRASTAQKKSW